ncbi:MAG: hypothetical protein ABI207_00825 [Crocinitomicaceae bacterium]
MSAIITLFENVEIKRIQFEEGDNNALLYCVLKQGTSSVETTIVVDFSDLNRLLAKLQDNNDSFDYSTLFDVFASENENNVYESNPSVIEQYNFTLDEITFHHPVRQIRA